MGRVKIKGNNHHLDIDWEKNAVFTEIYQELCEKLRPFYRLSGLRYEVNFLPFSSLTTQEKKQLSALCASYQIPCYQTEQNITVVKGPLRSGQEYTYQGNVLVLGDIHTGAQLIVEHGDLYVSGNITGMVRLHEKNCSIYAYGLQQAMIQIKDTILQDSTKNGCVKVYHNGVEVVIDTQEEVWEELSWLPAEREG